jgi:hypothetical protein
MQLPPAQAAIFVTLVVLKMLQYLKELLAMASPRFTEWKKMQSKSPVWMVTKDYSWYVTPINHAWKYSCLHHAPP